MYSIMRYRARRASSAKVFGLLMHPPSIATPYPPKPPSMKRKKEKKVMTVLYEKNRNPIISVVNR
jgi:hypothetical protein